jgi:putative oxidoreductase
MATNSGRILTMNFVPHSSDLGLLLLSLSVGLSLFLKHGWEKPSNFAAMAAHFPNPMHIGSTPGLLFALVSDAICSCFLILGFATRWSALWVFVNIFVAWSLVHHFEFFGRGADHGEVCVLYLCACLCLFWAGAGRYSLTEGWTRQSGEPSVVG